MICAAPAQLTPAFGHRRKAQPAPAKRKNCWLLSSPAAVLVLWGPVVSQALAVAPGRFASPERAQHQTICPGIPWQGKANAEGSQSQGSEKPSAGTCPREQARVPWRGHGADLPHGSGCFCVSHGWFPGRNNSLEPQGLLTGSSCCCFLKITIVGGLCSFSFFLNSTFSVMLQLRK